MKRVFAGCLTQEFNCVNTQITKETKCAQVRSDNNCNVRWSRHSVLTTVLCLTSVKYILCFKYCVLI